MTDVGEGDSFPLFSPGIIQTLQDRSQFLEVMKGFYVSMAERRGCTIELSARRFGEAHDYWIGDVKRMLTDASDRETKTLDHFKHAAIIAFWLRRLVPINDVWFVHENFVEKANHPPISGDSKRVTEVQAAFSQYGGELCALYVGFYICLAYETQIMALRKAGTTADPVILSDAISVRSLPAHFKSEFPRLLKHKNMSSQGIYMMYRSLFDQLEWTPAVRAELRS